MVMIYDFIHDVIYGTLFSDESKKIIRQDVDKVKLLINIVSEYYGIPVENIKKRGRFLDYVKPRQIISYIAMQILHIRSNVIATMLPVTSSTVRAAAYKIRDQLEIYKSMNEEVEEITICFYNKYGSDNFNIRHLKEKSDKGADK
jgi:chromosomal replication initiation ATPase DnaA